MKVNLSQTAIAAIVQIQENTIFKGIIEDAENFIIDHIDCDSPGAEKDNLAQQALDHIKGLRIIRKLISEIIKEEGVTE